MCLRDIAERICPISNKHQSSQFEERISQIVREATQARDVILFIDEIHTIVGAGGGGGALDAAQIMKPALARGEIDCIGATTQDEYNRFIRKDAALERRFSPAQIGELSDEATLRVLQGVAPRISAKHAEKTRLFETEKGLIIEVDDLARKVLLERGYSADLGARPLERAVDEWVVQPLVDAWFANRLRVGRVRFTAAAPARSSPRDLPGNVTVLGGARGGAGVRGASSSDMAITFSQE